MEKQPPDPAGRWPAPPGRRRGRPARRAARRAIGVEMACACRAVQRDAGHVLGRVVHLDQLVGHADTSWPVPASSAISSRPSGCSAWTTRPVSPERVTAPNELACGPRSRSAPRRRGTRRAPRPPPPRRPPATAPGSRRLVGVAPPGHGLTVGQLCVSLPMPPTYMAVSGFMASGPLHVVGEHHAHPAEHLEVVGPSPRRRTRRRGPGRTPAVRRSPSPSATCRRRPRRRLPAHGLAPVNRSRSRRPGAGSTSAACPGQRARAVVGQRETRDRRW